jgi:hypothetical protein
MTPATIDDPAILEEMADALSGISSTRPQPASVHRG